MNSLDAKLAAATMAFEDETFCVDGPLNKQRDALFQELVLAQRTAANKDEGGDKRINVNPVKIAQDKIDALEERMRDSMIMIRFTAVNKGIWNKWIIQHPPRKNNPLDAQLGYNTDEFFNDAAMATGQYVVDQGTAEAEYRDATLEPITPAQWAQFNEVFTAGDWDRIDTTLIQLNQRDGQRGVDFLLNGSGATTPSEPTSDSLATSE